MREHLAKHGFDPLMGARPMQRLIQDTIRTGAGRRAAVRQAAADGGSVTVDLDEDDKVQLTFDENPAPRNPNPERWKSSDLSG